ncbi:hypothetical protein ADUPG1_013173 [Aduncisulcus paluster]|uniref:Uncharacterized protein n=1 Tax=Aduncisulcus paluster TaxID=2918883 RepID=A0ABQ5K3S2_9EUKA|nr:hypothetical protein ADUPG1_013173 [Aduncisulcus paluster]
MPEQSEVPPYATKLNSNLKRVDAKIASELRVIKAKLDSIEHLTTPRDIKSLSDITPGSFESFLSVAQEYKDRCKALIGKIALRRLAALCQLEYKNKLVSGRRNLPRAKANAIAVKTIAGDPFFGRILCGSTDAEILSFFEKQFAVAVTNTFSNLKRNKESLSKSITRFRTDLPATDVKLIEAYRDDPKEWGTTVSSQSAFIEEFATGSDILSQPMLSALEVCPDQEDSDSLSDLV